MDPHSKLSYFNIANILSAADITGADAIHPGYGFLSENAEFARLCTECKVTFIGPPLRIFKQWAKKHGHVRLLKSGCSTFTGNSDRRSGLEAAVEEAEKIGYPVILKAAAGGGGRGIHIVYNVQQLRSSFERVSQKRCCFWKSSDVFGKILRKSETCGNPSSL